MLCNHFILEQKQNTNKQQQQKIKQKTVQTIIESPNCHDIHGHDQVY